MFSALRFRMNEKGLPERRRRRRERREKGK